MEEAAFLFEVAPLPKAEPWSAVADEFMLAKQYLNWVK